MTLPVNKRIILDLCGGTGAWSKPYADAGYDVRLWTLPKIDVCMVKLQALPKAHGVLAAPPCHHFAGSGAQYWKAKDADGRTKAALDIVHACLDIIEYTDPVFWALENPVGRLGGLLKHRLGEMSMIFNPCEYAGWAEVPETEAYSKRTCLWGKFWPPRKKPFIADELVIRGEISYETPLWKYGGKSERTKELRSITPLGFARAFFEANP